jgi:predicted nucleotidyltransferase
MIDLIANNLEAIRELCRTHGIERLDLFGSAATGTFDVTSSDIDFVVEMGRFDPDVDLRYLDLILELEQLLGYRVQMITEPSITRDYFRRAIDVQRVTLYDAGDRKQVA